MPKLFQFCGENVQTPKLSFDAAQSIPHLRVDISKRWVVISWLFPAIKCMDRQGVGVLWAKNELLDILEPIFSGGHMIENVTKEKATFSPPPQKFEAGTGRLEAVAGLGAAIDYMNLIGIRKIIAYEAELTRYCLRLFQKTKNVTLYGSKNAKDRLPVFAFNIGNIHPHDVGEILNRQQICVRTGHHCAQILHQVLGVSSTVRASFAIYNTKKDADKLFKGIEEVKRIFRI